MHEGSFYIGLIAHLVSDFWMRNIRTVERLLTVEDVRSMEYEEYEEHGKIIKWSSQKSLLSQTAIFYSYRYLPEDGFASSFKYLV